MLRLAAAVITALLLTAPSNAVRADDTPAAKPGVGVATFGSGCFWCTEYDFDKVPGVLTTTPGYMGGMSRKPTYDEVAEGKSGHIEVVQVTFDRNKVSYQMLLDYYWRTADVVDGRGQFCDRGNQYRPVIFTHDAEQAGLAKAGRDALDASRRFDKPVAVEIRKASDFTKAEPEHQNFHTQRPFWYFYYRRGCGRDKRLDRLWGKDRLDAALRPQTN